MSHEDFPTDEPAVVTCGLPYANGDLHIGHLRTYVGGDVFSRALEKLGQQTAFVCGSDMHGTPIAVQSIQEGVDPEEFALEYHEQYQETFPKFAVEFDNYGHTHEETNRELTHEIVRTLEEKGYVYEKEIKVAWDPAEDQPLPDRYVEGTCPYCGAKARGDECDEGCGRHLEPGEIEDPVSTITGNPAEYRDRTHKFFEVSELSEYLTDFLDRLEGTANARNQPRQWIEDGLQDWCITRDLDWGFDYPEIDGDDESSAEDLVLYVWVDAPIEYIASTKQYTERVGADTYDWEEAWKADGEIVHIIGRDIIQHHTIFWPAMLHVAEYDEPRAVMASGFMTLNGKGFSTSRNRAVWAREYLDEGFHEDLLRYYLATNGGFQQDVDFSWSKFRERVNGELVGTVGNFLYRSLLFAHRNFDGTPDASVSAEVEDRIDEAVDAYREAINDYSIRKAGQAAVELAAFGNEYIQRNEPWKLTDEDPDQAAQVIRDCVQVAKALAILLEPLTPGKAAALWDQLGEDGSVHETTVEDVHAAPPETFDEPAELFEKIEEDRVEQLNEKLEARVEEATEDGDDTETESDDTGGDQSGDMDLEPLVDDRISFEDFEGIDMRVGRIETAEPIEDSDKLVRLEVDIGVETRQVVAGIKQLHDIEELPGTKVILLANMEQAELFGVESNGMILAAGEEADLLTTHEDAPAGTRIQ
ncbi:methionine--tRNA ligase [Halapricum hydrolyticum]|uniref:Methionine--tRNA ligase n=1 Tax=Halapricum hydrolyticum TaxID=2979991 RepID=A0AAE3LFV8_9EURY|nr:methionine--tRNA ligase [Halapricum hydrolyticum]MCU4719476.1 methionine--tRNA ligase [Halapricum hydrolyticum]MCU4728087.1 methionine--tRNA ligase [Halapricum hydrolyticum]